MRIITNIRVCIQNINTHIIVRIIAHIVDIHKKEYKYSYKCMYTQI